MGYNDKSGIDEGSELTPTLNIGIQLLGNDVGDSLMGVLEEETPVVETVEGSQLTPTLDVGVDVLGKDEEESLLGTFEDGTPIADNDVGSELTPTIKEGIELLGNDEDDSLLVICEIGVLLLGPDDFSFIACVGTVVGLSHEVPLPAILEVDDGIDEGIISGILVGDDEGKARFRLTGEKPVGILVGVDEGTELGLRLYIMALGNPDAVFGLSNIGNIEG